MEAQMYNYSTWINETDPSALKEKLDAKLKISGFGVLKVVEYHFQPYGYTALWLLSESHLAVHTFPEKGKTYIELSSCVKKQFDKFVKLM